jgi:hypothetical protein
MLPKLIAAVACIVCLIALGAMGLRHNRQKGQAAASWQTGSLVEIARRAKAEGQDKARVSGYIFDYGEDMNLDETLKNYSVLIAETIEGKSFALDSRDIRTWYKFRILETLSPRSYWYCSTCPQIAALPQEMGQPNYDEFFVGISGGVINIEGIEITQPYSSVHFEEGNKYLMFVNLSPSQAAFIVGGPSGVFQLDKDDTLHCLNKENYPLPAEMEKRFGLKLSEFRSHLNR